MMQFSERWKVEVVDDELLNLSRERGQGCWHGGRMLIVLGARPVKEEDFTEMSSNVHSVDPIS